MDASLVMSLVIAYLAENPSYYCTYVDAYTQFRWSDGVLNRVRVGSHWRRLAEKAGLVDTIRCVCKQEHLRIPLFCK